MANWEDVEEVKDTLNDILKHNIKTNMLLVEMIDKLTQIQHEEF